MKTKELYKANGITFYTYEDVEKYAKENGYRITNTHKMKYKGSDIYLCDLTSK